MHFLLFLCLIFFTQPLSAKAHEKKELVDQVVAGELTLDQYVHLRGSRVTEGNVGNKGSGQPEYFEGLLEEHSWIQVIGEIGFNGGHSSEVFLKNAPEAIVYSFDIMLHGYAKIGKEYMDIKYPGRHTLIPGNSVEGVPAYHAENPELKFDLIFIDGGHSYPIALADLVNMKAFANPETILVLDDMQYPSVRKAYQECVDKKIITPGVIHSSKTRKWVECHYILD